MRYSRATLDNLDVYSWCQLQSSRTALALGAARLSRHLVTLVLALARCIAGTGERYQTSPPIQADNMVPEMRAPHTHSQPTDLSAKGMRQATASVILLLLVEVVAHRAGAASETASCWCALLYVTHTYYNNAYH